jgi:prepilin-type N-terminal cleavage/methylation domain-containing protein
MNKRRERGFSLIELLIVVAIIGIIAAVAIPNLLQSQRAARETAAVTEVQSIAKAQVQYSILKRGKFADLAALGTERLIDSTLAGGVKGGYQFTSTALENEGMAPMYDTTAKPTAVGTFGTGNTSYYSNETNVIYEAEGGEPPSATPQDRVPKNGTVFSR